MARHGRSHKSGGGFLKHWAETQKTRAKTQLINAQRKLEKLRDKRYWDQVRHERRKALWNGLKTIGRGVRQAGKVIREGTKALAKGARSAGRGVGNAGKSIGNRINKATKPVRDAYKITQDRNKRRKEYEAKARREFEKKESLRSRGLAAPDGVKTKDTKSAVKDAVQRAKKTTTTVSTHNRSKNGKTHEVGQHDRKLNPQEQDREVAKNLLDQSKPVPKPKKKSAKSNVIDLEIEKQRKKNRELGKQAKEIKQDTDRIKGKAPKLTGDEDKDFPAFQRRMKNLSDDLSQEKQNDIVRRLKDQMDNTKDSQQSKPGRNINTNGGNYERVDNDGFHVEGKSKDSKPKPGKSGGSKPTEYREINNNGIYINRDDK